MQYLTICKSLKKFKELLKDRNQFFLSFMGGIKNLQIYFLKENKLNLVLINKLQKIYFLMADKVDMIDNFVLYIIK